MGPSYDIGAITPPPVLYDLGPSAYTNALWMT